MNDQLLAQLDRRIDEHHQCLLQRLDDLADSLAATHAALSVRLDAHEAYHARNEHRWGLVKLAGRHPFRLAFLTFLAACVLINSFAEPAPWLQKTLSNLFKLLFG